MRIESFSKLGDYIYFEWDWEGKVPELYIIQYISSSLKWRSGSSFLYQKVEPAVSWDPRLRVKFTVLSTEEEEGSTSTLNFRIPTWTYPNGAKAQLNGRDYELPSPGSFLSITRKWIPDNEVSLDLPFGLRTERIKDDRPEFASLQAILFGPYVLAGLTNGDWEHKIKSPSSILNSITPIPSYYNSQLISLYQSSNNSTFALTTLNGIITTGNVPEPGTSASVHATFRIILIGSSGLSNFLKPEDAVGKRVKLEPFGMPGMVLSFEELGGNMSIRKSTDLVNCIFLLVPGLDWKKGSVSLMEKNEEDCFVHSGASYEPGSILETICKAKPTDAEFDKKASFVMKNGISSYDPISFVAKGGNGNFLLMPLSSLRDEYYTVYFNIQS